MIVSDFVPPIVKKIVRKVAPAFKVYNSFVEAEKTIPKGNDYNHDIVTNIVLAKTHRFVKELQLAHPANTPFATPLLSSHHLFLLTAISLCDKKGPVKVLDFGGAFGTHYWVAKAYFPHKQFDWTVIELPGVVNKADALSNDELHFLDLNGDLTAQFPDVDVMLTGTTLQHVPDPDVALQFLLRQQASMMIFLRLGLNGSDAHLWGIHHARYQDCGPGPAIEGYSDGILSLPFCMMSATRFEKACQDYYLHLASTELSGIQQLNKSVTGFNRLYLKR